MPILIVASALYILFPSRKAGARFLVPSELRARVARELPDGAPRDTAIAILDEFIELARDYCATTESALDAYAAHTRSGNFTAASCIEAAQPAERVRAETLRQVVRIRGQLLEVLSDEQWSALFD